MSMEDILPISCLNLTCSNSCSQGDSAVLWVFFWFFKPIPFSFARAIRLWFVQEDNEVAYVNMVLRSWPVLRRQVPEERKKEGSGFTLSESGVIR